MNTQRKPRVHLGCEVHLISGIHDAVLVPGQAFPISLYQGKLADRVSVPGRVEIRIFASLWAGDELYTDLGSAPMSVRYIKDHGLASTICAHSAKNGFGITVLDTRNNIPGAFTNDSRLSAEYPVDEILEREYKSMRVAGPEAYVYMVPHIYARVVDSVQPIKGEVQLWDALDEKVHRFVQLPVPVVLGEFDTFSRRQEPWQKELLREAMIPGAYEPALLQMMLTHASFEPGIAGYFDDTCYYYAVHCKGGNPNPRFMWAKDYRGYLADLPYVKRDVWFPIDLGRRHVLTWKDTFKHRYSS